MPFPCNRIDGVVAMVMILACFSTLSPARAAAPDGSALGVMDLTWAPTVPEIGEMVLFSITGYPGPIRAEWDFGEPGCPGFPQVGTCDPTFTSCHDWGFRFRSGGSKAVSVIVRDPNTNDYLGSTTASARVEATGSCDGGDEIFVTQSFHASGAGGAKFQHEMELFNSDTSEAVVRFDWLPQGEDNSTPPLSTTVGVPGQTAIRMDNVLFEVFALGPDAIGALRLVPDLPTLQVNNIGVNFNGVDALGWSIPTLGSAQGLADGVVGHILFLVEDAELRSNLHCLNMSSMTVQIAIDLFAADGTWLDTRFMNLQPLSTGQLNRVFANYSPVLGYAAISHAQPGAVVACSGMVVDNLSNDARSEPFTPAPIPGETFYLPRVVHDVESTTHLALFAPDGAAEARVDFLPTAQNNSSYSSAFILLADKQQYVFVEVLDSLFSAGGTGALRIVAASGTVEVTAVETKEPSGVWMHRHARVSPVGEQVPAHHPASIIHLTENANRRTDIGVANTSGLTIDVTIDLRDAAESVLGRRITQLLPFSHIELGGIFASIGHPEVDDGLARVFTSTPGGSFFAYAVVTDLNTQDSWEIPAELLPAGIFADGFESGDPSGWSTTAP